MQDGAVAHFRLGVRNYQIINFLIIGLVEEAN